ncbi:adenosylcobalamin-dependent ribonucleoside-diphosphate reductase [Candidatus Dojkabacteria bacterium]|jgi:ribonucleoside-diphosphate reductase alpha chain|nr:adenosylcobalamin-dependent ribonucleoside-diphosphate reductase [Candidatus Dojkabacteria bacterium]
MLGNLQGKGDNALNELGEKIFLDRYAIKDAKKETLTVGDTVVVCVNLKTGQREIAIIESIDQNAREVSVKLRDGTSEVHSIDHIDKPLETKPEQMFARIAKHIASVEKTPELQVKWEQNFLELMNDWKYVPAGRIFTGAGTGQALTFYNCYVIPSPKDSRGGIFETLRQMAEVMSRGGGVGINVSTLRPRYAYVKGVNGRSSGSVSWASLYSYVTGLIEQGGSRRGALMLILNVWHPDILDFINSKKESGKITNANISVGITDDFMKAVKEDANWDLVFPDTADPLYAEKWDGNIIHWKELGGSLKRYKTVKARDIWSNIIESAWSSAEPGMYFIDRANYMSNSWYYADLISTNPCGEQPLAAWSVCNLGHVNLAKHLVGVSGDYEVAWEKLAQTVRAAVRFQDNVIDATPYFFDENYKQQMSERRVGMGTIGLAEMLVKLKLRYGSPDALLLIDQLYKTIAEVAYETSVQLAVEKGAFSKFDLKFLDSGFMKQMPEYIRALIAEHGIRNVTILTQAPTGTVGTMVGTSTGIEPFFAWTYFRKSRLGVHEETVPLLKDWEDANPGKDIPDYFVTAMELTPEEHVRVQAAVQRWTDSAISKTCNAPENYTVEQTKKLYELMYDLGCKGGTIYRDGSRDKQILATDFKKLGDDAGIQKGKEGVIQEQGLIKVAPKARPMKMTGATYRIRTPYGNLFITINDNGTGPFEVFAQLGKAGGFFNSQMEAVARLISLALRSNISVSEVIDQITGIRGPDVSFMEGSPIYSLPDAIGKALKLHINQKVDDLNKDVEVLSKDEPKKQSLADFGHAPICGMCGMPMELGEGCMKCPHCGFSKCG